MVSPSDGQNLSPLVLWTYRTLKRTSIQVTPFSLIYRAETVVPVEIRVPSVRLAFASKVSDHKIKFMMWRPSRKRQNTEDKWLTYSKWVDRASIFQKECYLVLKAANHVQKNVSVAKFTRNKKDQTLSVKLTTVSTSLYIDSTRGEGGYLTPINRKWLKPYFS